MKSWRFVINCYPLISLKIVFKTLHASDLYVSTSILRSISEKFISTSNKLFLYNQNKCAVKKKADASGKKIFSQRRLLKISILLKLTSAFMQNNSKNMSLFNIPDDVLVFYAFFSRCSKCRKCDGSMCRFKSIF